MGTYKSDESVFYILGHLNSINESILCLRREGEEPVNVNTCEKPSAKVS